MSRISSTVSGAVLRLSLRVALLLVLAVIVVTSIDVSGNVSVLGSAGPPTAATTTAPSTTTTTRAPTRATRWTPPTTATPVVVASEALSPPVTTTPATTIPAATTSAPAVVPPPAGPRPPQFVVVSFDGARDHLAWDHWLAVGEQTGAHMTFFLSGVYLLDETTRGQYTSPGHPPGTSDIGVSTPDEIDTLVADLTRAKAVGDEIGTHFNGHFCGATGGDSWSTADWTSEITQFESFVEAQDLPFAGDISVGGRTPCLEGRPDQYHPAMTAAGFRYDASGTGSPVWPSKVDGLWDLPLPSIPLAGTGRTTLAMDYNFYYAQSKAGPATPDQLPAFRQQVYDSYQGAFQRVYTGNRAPLILGNHFAPWNGGIYRSALTDFMVSACTQPDVRCVSFVELTDWLDAQSPDYLATLRG